VILKVLNTFLGQQLHNPLFHHSFKLLKNNNKKKTLEKQDELLEVIRET